MSIVQYVLHGGQADLDRSVWLELGSRLAADGFPLHFRAGDGSERKVGEKTVPPPSRSFQLSTRPRSRHAGVLMNLETRDSNGSFDAHQAWSPEARRLLNERPHSIFLQALFDEEVSLEFWSAVADTLVELLDGVAYDESSGTLSASNGASFRTGEPDTAPPAAEDDDPELDLDSVTGRGVAVLECPAAFSANDLSGILSLEVTRLGKLSRSSRQFEEAARASTWKELELGSQLVLVRVGAPSRLPAAVRASLNCSPELARQWLLAMQQRLQVKLIDFEPES